MLYAWLNFCWWCTFSSITLYDKMRVHTLNWTQQFDQFDWSKNWSITNRPSKPNYILQPRPFYWCINTLLRYGCELVLHFWLFAILALIDFHVFVYDDEEVIANLPTVPPYAAAKESSHEVAKGGDVGGQVAGTSMVRAVWDFAASKLLKSLKSLLVDCIQFIDALLNLTAIQLSVGKWNHQICH